MLAKLGPRWLKWSKREEVEEALLAGGNRECTKVTPVGSMVSKYKRFSHDASVSTMPLATSTDRVLRLSRMQYLPPQVEALSASTKLRL